MDSLPYYPSPASSSGSTSSGTPDDRPQKAAREITFRSRSFVDALNSRSFKRFHNVVGQEHISEDFTAYLDNQSLAFDWPQFVSVLHNAAAADPDYHADIIDQSVDIDDRSGHAYVFIFVEITGRPKHVRREDALVFEWRRSPQGVWKCHGHTAIRGTSGLRLMTND